MRRLSDDDFERLLMFRSGLRRFLHWSDERASAAGLTPAQHQLLLAVRGHSDGDPTIGDIANHLLIRHNSAVELIDRASAAGLVRRSVDHADQRIIHIELTKEGNKTLEGLTALHLEELARVAPTFRKLWAGLEGRSAR